MFEKKLDPTLKNFELILEALKQQHEAMKIQGDMFRELAKHLDQMEDRYATLFQYILGKLK